MADTPRVWIGCLASYNAGRLIGEWVDAVDVDEMNECRDRVAAEAIAAAKKAGEWPVYFTQPEEFFLADNEGFGRSIGEYENWQRVADLGAAIEEHGAGFLAFLSIYDDASSEDVDEIVSAYEDRAAGRWESPREFAQDYVDQCGWSGVAPDSEAFKTLSAYLDWDAIERDLMMDYVEAEGGYIFRAYS